jgi:hypothetical protein
MSVRKTLNCGLTSVLLSMVVPMSSWDCWDGKLRPWNPTRGSSKPQPRVPATANRLIRRQLFNNTNKPILLLYDNWTLRVY